MAHIEVPIKVNAWVDRGIAPLVEALNAFKELWTTSSCQGNGQFAHVHFGFNGAPERFAEFVNRLSVAVGKRISGDNEYRIMLEWVAGAEKPLGAIVARQEVVPELAKAITAIAVSSARTSRSQRGIRGTKLRSLRGRRNPQHCPL